MTNKIVFLILLFCIPYNNFSQSAEEWEKTKKKGKLSDYFFLVASNLKEKGPYFDSARTKVHLMLREQGSISSQKVYEHLKPQIAPFKPADLVSSTLELMHAEGIVKMDNICSRETGKNICFNRNVLPKSVSNVDIYVKEKFKSLCTMYFNPGEFWEAQIRFKAPSGFYFIYARIDREWYLISSKKVSEAEVVTPPKLKENQLKEEAITHSDEGKDSTEKKIEPSPIHISEPIVVETEDNNLYPSPAFVNIGFEGEQIFINGFKIPKDCKLEDLKPILGSPSRTKIRSKEEIAKNIEKYGSRGNNVYTYDKLGIRVYEKIEPRMIGSISVGFVKEDYSFSPSNIFDGDISLGNINIDGSTSLARLKNIENLKVEESLYRKMGNTSYYFDNHLYFSFKDDDKTGLKTVSFILFRNSDIWKEEDIALLRKYIGKDELKEIAKKNDFDQDAFFSCYVEKVSFSIAVDLFRSDPDRLEKVLNDLKRYCIIRLSRKK